MIIAMLVLIEKVIVISIAIYQILKGLRFLNKSADNNTIYDKYTLEHILFGDSYFNKVRKNYDQVFNLLLESNITDDGMIDSLIEQVKDRRDSVKVASLPSVIAAISSALTAIFVALSSNKIDDEFRTILFWSIPFLGFVLIGVISFIVYKIVCQPYDMVVLNALYAYKRYIKAKNKLESK